jgi:transposase
VEGIVGRLVPDELWELFQRVVPEAPVRPQGGGRRRHGDREVLAAIVFVATSGCTWQQLPAASFGPSGATAHRRFSEWSKARVWAKLHRLVLDELGSRGELDWSRCAIDSVNMRALKRGPDGSQSCRSRQVRLKDPADHRPQRSALSVGISGANLHDSQALIPLVKGIPPIRSRCGPRRRRPAKLHADKGYDYGHLRRWLSARGIRHRIARKAWTAPSGWAATAGPSNAPWPGSPAAADSTAATNEKPGTSSPSPASPAPSSATADSPNEMTC